MSVTKNTRLVRLSNGVVEYEEHVGAAIVALRALSTSNSKVFDELCRWVLHDTVPPHKSLQLMAGSHYNLVKSLDPPQLYDDVRDVAECAITGRGGRYGLSFQYLDDDQSGLK